MERTGCLIVTVNDLLHVSALQLAATRYDVYPSCLLFHNPNISSVADWNAASSFINGACMRRTESNSTITIPPQLKGFEDVEVRPHPLCTPRPFE